MKYTQIFELVLVFQCVHYLFYTFATLYALTFNVHIHSYRVYAKRRKWIHTQFPIMLKDTGHGYFKYYKVKQQCMLAIPYSIHKYIFIERIHTYTTTQIQIQLIPCVYVCITKKYECRIHTLHTCNIFVYVPMHMYMSPLIYMFVCVCREQTFYVI